MTPYFSSHPVASKPPIYFCLCKFDYIRYFIEVNHTVFVFWTLPFYHLAYCPQVSCPQGYCPCCSMGPNFLSFYSWIIFLCTQHHFLFIHFSWMAVWAAFIFQLLWTKLLQTWVCKCLLWPHFQFFWVYTQKWDCSTMMVISLLVFWRNHHTLSIATAPFYVPNERSQRFSSSVWPRRKHRSREVYDLFKGTVVFEEPRF